MIQTKEQLKNMAIATAAVIAVGGLALSSSEQATVPQELSQASQNTGGGETYPKLAEGLESGQAFIDAVAKDINERSETERVYIKLDYTFLVNSDKQEELGIAEIRNPLLTGENTLGYLTVDKDGNTLGVAVNAIDGRLVDSGSSDRHGDGGLKLSLYSLLKDQGGKPGGIYIDTPNRDFIAQAS